MSANLKVVDEIVLGDTNTEQTVHDFIERTSPFSRFQTPSGTIYGDASGNSRSTKSSRTDYQLIQDIFQHDRRYRGQNKSNPLVRDRVNTMNNLLKSVEGQRNVLIHPRCKELIQDLRQVRWHRDTAGNPTGELDKSDPRRTHASDALSYLVAQEWALRSSAGAQSGIFQ